MSNVESSPCSNFIFKDDIQIYIDVPGNEGIELLEGDVWGHRKDINEYYEIKPRIFDRIEELKKEGTSKEEIVSKLGVETRLSEDLIKFLV